MGGQENNVTQIREMNNVRGLYDLLVNAIIRPPRAPYLPEMMGPNQFSVRGKGFVRTDFELTNPRGLKLACSHYEPIGSQRKHPQLPCVIYLHGNCGCRLEGLDIAPIVLPYNITLVTIDLSGSGLSEGEYISLGYFEKDDVATLVKYLRDGGTVSRIALYGRSMGAATAIMYGAMDPSIACLILDSPFSSLHDLAVDLCNSPQMPVSIPRLAVSMGLKVIRRTILDRAKFDIDELNPEKHAESCFMPALIVHGREDQFVKPIHSQKIYEKYAGDKNRILVDGDHNGSRPSFFKDSAFIFLKNALVGDDPELNKAMDDMSFTSHFEVPNAGNYHMQSIFQMLDHGGSHPMEGGNEAMYGHYGTADEEERLLQQALINSLEDLNVQSEKEKREGKEKK